MKTRQLLASFALLLALGITSALAQPISITNPSFEAKTGANSGTNNAIAGWTAQPSTFGNVSGVSIPPLFTSGLDGSNAIYLNGGIFQDTGAKFATGTTYTLSISIGKPSGGSANGGGIQFGFRNADNTGFIAGSGQAFISKDTVNAIPAGTFQTFTISYTAVAGDADKAILIGMYDFWEQSATYRIDNVQLSSVPSGLTATAGNAQVVLTWNTLATATSYSVLRSTTSGSGYVSVATGLTSPSYTDTGLTNRTTYFYVVTATNLGGTSANSTELSSFPSSDEPLPAKIRVLFIGNSYTHTHDIPSTVAMLFKSQGVVFEPESNTPGGASLGGHLTNGYTLPDIRRGGWDYVVLQDQSARPLNSRNSVIADITTFCAEIRAVGALPLLYQTWPTLGSLTTSPTNGPTINETYRLASVATGATLVPVGTGRPAANAAVGAVNMYISDGSHPSPTGSYFSALTFYRTISRRPTLGMPRPSDVSQANATAMQIAADGVPLADTVAPTFNLAAGTYAGPQRIVLQTVTPQATIYYTTDGTTPTTASARMASGGVVTLTGSATLQALAVGAGTTSGVTSATYTLTSTNGQTLFGNGGAGPVSTSWPAKPANLATSNPGFENGVASPWAFYGGTGTVNGTFTYNGSFAVQITSGGGMYRSQTGLQPSTLYEASIRYRFGTDTSYATWTTRGFSTPSVSIDTNYPNGGPALAWRRFPQRFTTDASTTQVEFNYHQSTLTGSVDDLELYKVPEGFELGVKLRTSAPGRVTALRVWRPENGPTAYTLRLWDSGGNLLNTASITGLSATGWVEVPLATPRRLATNTTYVVSYGVAEGVPYAATANGLAAVKNDALSGDEPANGLVALGRGTFPVTATGVNYWTDARFVPLSNPREIWQATNFSVVELDNAALEATVWGLSADPDRDGIPNLLEYALSLSPTTANTAGQPVAALDGNGKLTLSFLRARSDVTYTVQGSSDLATWTDLEINPGTVSTIVTVTDKPPVGATKRFLRLRVTSP